MNRLRFYSFLLFAAVLGSAVNAHATDISAINTNVNASIINMPGLISGLSYILGLLLGILGINKLRQHVEDPRSNNLKDGVIRLLAGGALLAIPTIYTAAATSIYGAGGPIAAEFAIVQDNSAANMGITGALFGGNINVIFRNIAASLQNTPGLVSGISYLLALVLGVSGVLQIKDHVQSPEQVPIRSGIIRLLASGAFFALPTIYEALLTSIQGTGTIFTRLNTLVGSMGSSSESGTTCAAAAGGSLGGVLCNLYTGSAAFPLLMTAASYLFGLVLGIWGISKIKEHVINPERTTIWEGITRLAAAGAFFALPTILEALIATIVPGLADHRNTGFTGAAAALGLDRMMTDFVNSIFGPLDVLIDFFGYVAGTVLIMIGISRLLKSSQEGVRGPGGIGTIMTFLTGGALLSFSPMISAFTMSLFNGPTTTMAALTYTAGLTGAEVEHIHAVISAMLKFVLVLGLISFMRGIFIIRSVAEGNQQASMMAGVTHLVGGALAVNLGPFLNAVQTTLGIAGFGVNFT